MSKQTSKCIFATKATNRITGEVRRAELFHVVEEDSTFYVSNDEKLIKEALEHEATHNPIFHLRLWAMDTIRKIETCGFRTFEDV